MCKLLNYPVDALSSIPRKCGDEPTKCRARSEISTVSERKAEREQAGRFVQKVHFPKFFDRRKKRRNNEVGRFT